MTEPHRIPVIDLDTVAQLAPFAVGTQVRYSQAKANAEYQRVLQILSERTRWWSLSEEGRYRYDPHRYRAELLDRVHEPEGYLCMVYPLMAKREGIDGWETW